MNKPNFLVASIRLKTKIIIVVTRINTILLVLSMLLPLKNLFPIEITIGGGISHYIKGYETYDDTYMQKLSLSARWRKYGKISFYNLIGRLKKTIHWDHPYINLGFGLGGILEIEDIKIETELLNGLTISSSYTFDSSFDSVKYHIGFEGRFLYKLSKVAYFGIEFPFLWTFTYGRPIAQRSIIFALHINIKK